MLFNVPVAATAVGLVYWLLHQQAAKLKAAQSQADRRRGTPAIPPSAASSPPLKQRAGMLAHP